MAIIWLIIAMFCLGGALVAASSGEAVLYYINIVGFIVSFAMMYIVASRT